MKGEKGGPGRAGPPFRLLPQCRERSLQGLVSTARPADTTSVGRMNTEVLLPMLRVDAPVTVRVATRADGWRAHEYASRVEEVTDTSVVVSLPPGANSALLASGTREVDLSWLSPRGRYEQACRLEPGRGRHGSVKYWRLRPLRSPVLIQRRRYIRVRADLDVTLELHGAAVQGTTVDVSEGGFRVRIPRCDIPELQPTVVRATIGDRDVALAGFVIRATDAFPEGTDAVVAFQAGGPDAEAVRKLVLHSQLRARAAAYLSSRDS